MYNCQQEELYAAESSVARGRQFASVKEVQAFVSELRDTPWWQRLYSGVKYVEVNRSYRDGSCGGMVGSDVGQMDMHPAHWCERIVLHELAHVLADYRYGSHAHCPWFARTYLELVSFVMGPDVYVALKDSFDKSGIDYDADTNKAGAIAL